MLANLKTEGTIEVKIPEKFWEFDGLNSQLNVDNQILIVFLHRWFYTGAQYANGGWTSPNFRLRSLNA